MQLARLHLEVREKARDHQTQLEFRLRVEKLEIEADEKRLRQLELDLQRETRQTANTSSISTRSQQNTLDISKHAALVQSSKKLKWTHISELLERMAAALEWPAEVWSLQAETRTTKGQVLDNHETQKTSRTKEEQRENHPDCQITQERRQQRGNISAGPV